MKPDSLRNLASFCWPGSKYTLRKRMFFESRIAGSRSVFGSTINLLNNYVAKLGIEGMPVVEQSTTVHADVLCGDSCAA